MSNRKSYKQQYAEEIAEKTRKYQQIYGFGIGKGQEGTHNNEFDAFRHAFMQADLALKLNLNASEYLGNRHENSREDNPVGEKNMDLWNNYVGREISKEIVREYGFIPSRNLKGKMDDVIAEKIIREMKRGGLITNPKDKRSFEEFKENASMDFNTNLPVDKIFTLEEIENMPISEFQQNEKAIDRQIIEFGIPYEYQAKQEVNAGTMEWVNSYYRDDGTYVRGYYRRKNFDY